MSEAAVVRQPELRVASAAWLVACAGFSLAYAPVYWSAAHGVWQTDENGHGPLILAVVAWLFWSLREPIARRPRFRLDAGRRRAHGDSAGAV